MMARNMYRAGIEPRQISTIIVTHFHPDHIWGLMGKETNSQVFPDAQIVVPEVEYKFWTAPDLIAKLPEARRGAAQRIQATLPKWRNIKQIADGKEVIPGVRAMATHGHTPGHTSYVVTSGRQSMIVSGDVTNIAGINLRNADWQLVFDSDPAAAVASRRKVMDLAIKGKSIVTGYHWGLPGAGTIKKDGKGYVLAPVKA
jgi:glyoxylase-like metal-dependent hydrolase (beta-lactamase superfamily II)